MPFSGPLQVEGMALLSVTSNSSERGLPVDAAAGGETSSARLQLWFLGLLAWWNSPAHLWRGGLPLRQMALTAARRPWAIQRANWTGSSDIKDQLSVSLCLRCVIPNPLFIRLYGHTISFFSSRVIIEKKHFNGKFRAGLPAPNKKAMLHLQGVIIQTGSIVLFHGFIILGQAPLCQ